MTQQRLWVVFAVFVGVCLGIQVSRPVDLSDLPETSYDTAPRGHAAVFALLESFEASPGRWLSGLTLPSVPATVWWIAPDDACDDESPPPVEQAEGNTAKRRSAFEEGVRPWLEAGGTAIVWLSHPPIVAAIDAAPVDPDRSGRAPEEDADEKDVEDLRDRWERETARVRAEVLEGQPRRCASIAGFAIPPRHLAGLEGGEPPEQGRYSPVVFSIGRATPDRDDFDYTSTRVLPGPTLAFFDRSDASAVEGLGWRPLWVEADDFTPFALERSVGAGRLVVIADARAVSNGRLAHVDSAPFVFDWVRDFGAPWIDEHAHGVVPETGTFRYLATSPAWASGLALLGLVLLVIWHGHAWPTRRVSEIDPDTPTLAAYVDSLARLYAGTRDHERVFERYRAVSLDRIRRALGLAPGTGIEIILANLRARARNWPTLREAGLAQLLSKDIPIPGASDLIRNAARLDDLVRVLRGGGGAGTQRRSRRRSTVHRARGRK